MEILSMLTSLWLSNRVSRFTYLAFQRDLDFTCTVSFLPLTSPVNDFGH